MTDQAFTEHMEGKLFGEEETRQARHDFFAGWTAALRAMAEQKPVAQSAIAAALDQLRTAALIDDWHTFDAVMRETQSMLAAPVPAIDVAKENDLLTLARLFHSTYERLAPEYGYETRPDTKDFDPESKNGRLMVRVCAEISNAVFCPKPVPTIDVDEALRLADEYAYLRREPEEIVAIARAALAAYLKGQR